MAKVLIVGAHGKIARLATPLLVSAGHSVSGVVRKPEQSDDVRADGAEPVVADVEQLSTPEITDLVRGHDVVVWAAGAGGDSPERTYAVDRDAAIRTIDAAGAAGTDRFVIVSYFGAGPDHGVDPGSGFYAYAEAKTEADAHLAAADLGWTILRPSGLTDEAGTGGIETGPDVSAATVSRTTVAQLITAVVSFPERASGTTLEFNDGDQSIDEVLAS